MSSKFQKELGSKFLTPDKEPISALRIWQRNPGLEFGMTGKVLTFLTPLGRLQHIGRVFFSTIIVQLAIMNRSVAEAT